MTHDSRIHRTLVCAFAAVVLVALSCRVIGAPDPAPGPLPGIDAITNPAPLPPFGDAGITPDVFPPFDAPDDAIEPPLDAPE